MESLALEEDSLKDYVPLIHRYPLESHGVVSVAPLGAETQPIFRTYWNHYTPESTLIPPGTQYGATRGNPEQRKPLRYAAFAIPCTPLQRLSDHS